MISDVNHLMDSTLIVSSPYFIWQPPSAVFFHFPTARVGGWTSRLY